ncbi:MBG domain-containing protein [Phreatobacter stygius]|nr:MBG domain-containing protein [Phreatobacter stygius]
MELVSDSRKWLRHSVSVAALCAAMMPLAGGSGHGQTLPTGGRVATGSATIGPAGAGALTINQTSQRAVINWNAFSVGQGGTVSFQQPNSSSATLNRVTGATSSTIAGQVRANGQVYLVNPNGIQITRTGSVDTAGFTASTLDTTNDDFMAGRQRYAGNGRSAEVTNQGRIRVRGGGDAVLIGGRVTNEGSISAHGGRVGLGSGERVSVDVEGDGFLTVSVPTNDPDRARALIRQVGRINASGGRVEVRAATSADVARAAIQLGGSIEASGVAQTGSGVRFGGPAAAPAPDRPSQAARRASTGADRRSVERPAATRPASARPAGSVVVDGGAGGRVSVTGRVNVASPNQSGGAITVTGRAIDLSGARLDASGATGGGRVRIGGDYQGSGPLQRAETVSVDAATVIRADATARGDGGRVIIWSDQQTRFAGTISAQGGGQGGDGGFAEVSGKATLSFTGSADLRAADGRFGTLLLDPYNVTISNDPDSNQSGFTATGDNSVINAGTLQNQLALSNVTISTGSGGSQAGDITVAAPLVWSSGSVLTLSAYHSIAVNANLFITGAGGLAFNTNQGGSGGTLSFAFGAGTNYIGTPHTGQTLSINGQSYTLIYDVSELQAINSNLSGRYALARPIDGGPTASWNGGLGMVALGMDSNSNIQNGGNGFTGTFEGLGNVIYNLNVRQIPTNYVGMFGYVGTTGVISNVGLRNVTISGQENTGAIAGLNRGTITRAWADGKVDGTFNTGGLVGYNAGTISQSFSNAGVTARDRNNIGGLVGRNEGALSQVYATGAVIGGEVIGGLVGFNAATATINQAFATGAVGSTPSATALGGLIGSNASPTVTNAFFVTETTGRGAAVGIGTAIAAPGLSLAQFLTGGPRTGFAGGAGGIMPYLANFYPNGAEMISGTAYKDLGLTPLVSGIPQPIYANNHGYVATVIEGIEYGRVTTGANGYYATLLPVGTLASGARVLTFTNLDLSANTSGAKNAATLAVATGAGLMTGLNIYGSILTAQTSATLLSQVGTIDASGAAGTSPTALAALAGTTGRGYLATGASFTIDVAQTLNGQQLFVKTQNGAPLTVAATIDLRNNSALALYSGGALAINANVTTYGAGSVSMSNGAGSDYSFGNSASMSFYNAAGGAFIPPPGFGAIYDQITGQYLTINGAKYYIAYSRFQLDEIDGQYAHDGAAIAAYGTGLGGNFALAYNLDLTSATYSRTLVGRDAGTAFSGKFTGLGHTIRNFSMSVAGNNVGLFGYVDGGTIRDIGIVNGAVAGGAFTGGLIGYMANGAVLNTYSYANVTGVDSVGGLVGFAAGASTIARSTARGSVAGASMLGGLAGYSEGSISDSYATGTVTANGTAQFSFVGGLVGRSLGQISRSFATGTASGVDFVGGLVGMSFGTISQSYATGGVRGVADVGGLVGANAGAVSEAFATGAVIGQSTVGGLIGLQSLGSVTASFFDTGTTGQTAAAGQVDGGTVGAAGLTTAQIQTGGLAAFGFDPAVWGGAAGGLYPYLKSFYGSGVQAISGTAYRSDGTTGFGSDANGFVSVALASGGGLSGTATTGANGYYYILLPANGLSGNAVVSMTANAATGAQNSATVKMGISGTTAGVNLQNGWRIVGADASIGSLSAVNSLYTAATSGTPAAGMTFVNQRIDAAATAFVVDQAVSLTGTLALTSDGTVTQTTAIAASNLQLGGAGTFTLVHAANQVGTLAGDVGKLTFANSGNLTIGRIASAGFITAGISADDTVSVTAGGAITIAADATVSGASPVLAAGTTFTNLRGSDAVSATSGRWLIYSSAPSGNTFGGLDSGQTAIFNQTPATLAPGSVGQSGNRYIFAHQPTLTFTSIDSTKAYGDDGAAALASRYVVTGIDPGVSGAYLADSAATVFAGAPVLTSAGTGASVGAGGGYAISITQGTLTSTAGYAISLSSLGTLTVTQRAITVTADGKSRIYGDANPALTYALTSGSLVNGDTLTGGLETGALNTSGVGSYLITQGSLGNANYAITYVGANLDITPRAITVAAEARNRVYGDANPALTYAASGLLFGDTLTGSLVTGATQTSGVGIYGITQGTLGNTNYSITYASADLTITPRAIAVTADAVGRVYGDANPALTYAAPGLLFGDTLSGALATGATAASGVGTYAITQGSLANPNYTITAFTGASLTVTQRAVTVTADAANRVYGDANPAFGYQVTSGSLVNGDTLGGALTSSATASSSVGSYGITQGTLANGNYAITYVGASLAVMQRAITVAADATSRVYGDANPALTYQATGLLFGDSLTGALATGATATSGVGSYAITRSTLANVNYAISYSGANLTVTPRALTVAADAKSRIYGDANPALTYTAAGLLFGDTLAGGLATGATATSGVGGHAITQGTLANANYAISYAGADLTITPRAITVTANAASRIYGDANPALTYAATGLLFGDTLAGSLATGATGASGVGAYAITQGSLGNANYAVTYADANLTVTARPITITAHDLSRIYGDANPSLTFTVGGSGLGNGDVLAGALTTAAGAGSNVGGYAIGQGTVSANYTVTSFTGATLTVTARPVTITAVDMAKSFGQADPALAYLVGGMGLVDGDQPTGSLTREAGESIGSYAILAGSLALSSNYQVNFIQGRFTVMPTPAPVAIGQLATLSAPPPSPVGAGGDAVLAGLTAAGPEGGVNCRPQPAGGLTCP